MKKFNFSILIVVVVILLLVLTSCQKNEVFFQEEVNLDDHYLYSTYNFSDDPNVIDFGIQPLWIPTSTIIEIMRRDEVLLNELEKLGMEIRFHVFLKGDDVNYFIENGKLEAGIGGDMPAIRIAANEKARIVSLIQEGHVSIVSRDIAEISGLEGKKVGFAMGSNAHFYLLNTLKKNDVKISDIKLVSMDVTMMKNALVDGKIDAFAAWEPTPTITLKENPAFVITHRGTSFGFMYVSDDFFKKEEAVKHLVASEIRSLRWIRHNRGNFDIASEFTLESAKLLNEGNILSVEDVNYLAQEDLPGIYTKYFPRVNNGFIDNVGIINEEFILLQELGLVDESKNWKDVKERFEKDIVEDLISESDEYKLFETPFDEK